MDMRTSIRPFLAALTLLPATLLMPLGAQAQTYTVRENVVSLTQPAEAVVEAVRQAVVAAQVTGRVVEVRADAGQKVAAGQTVMRIDAREAVEAAAAAQAQWVQAQASHDRTRGLYERKFVSAAALDKAEADLKTARAQASAASASQSYAQVASPMAGVVALRQAELGEMATPGRPLFTVFDPAGLRAVAAIPQQALGPVKAAGAKARVEVVETGQWLEAVRVELLPTLEARSHTATARVYLPAAAGLAPGMAVRVHFVAGDVRRITVPVSSVLRRGEVTAVYLADGGKPARLRQVRLGETKADGSVEVLAGLAAGEIIHLDAVKAGTEQRTAK